MTTSTTKAVVASLMGLAAGMGGMTPSSSDHTPIPVTTPVMRMTRRMLTRMANGPVVRWGYAKFPKQTVKQNQRAAAKTKNRAKHRAACRG